MKRLTAPTIVIEIFLAGSREQIEHEAMRYCFEVGCCVSVEQTKFIYTAGQEDGCLLRLVNYPRFPSNVADLMARGETLALRLMEAGCQWSALIVGPEETVWLTRRPDVKP